MRLLIRSTCLLLAAVLCVAGLAANSASAKKSRGKHTAAWSKRDCAYSANRIATLRRFSRLVHRSMDCALVYSASPDWAGWEDPWFIHHPDPGLNWAKWKRAGKGRRDLIVTQSLIPYDLRTTAWRTAGSRGRYKRHARALARNLVRAGLGDVVIRLAHESNGTWNADSIGKTPRDFRLWRRFWRVTVKTMRSVPGAHFRFDFCVNAGVRPIPLRRFYPGDDVVDIVGIDAYDAGVRGQRNRWNRLYSQPVGLRDVLRFARRHRKPLSLPEWGIAPRNRYLAGGDDPAYVAGLARIMRTQRTAYQSYFFNHEFATQLTRSPRSLSTYRRYFGGGAR